MTRSQHRSLGDLPTLTEIPAQNLNTLDLFKENKRQLSFSSSCSDLNMNKPQSISLNITEYLTDDSSNSYQNGISQSVTFHNSTINTEIYRSESYQMLLPRKNMSRNLDIIEENSNFEVFQDEDSSGMKDFGYRDVQESNYQDCLSNTSLPTSPVLSIVENLTINKSTLSSAGDFPTCDIEMDIATDHITLNEFMKCDVMFMLLDLHPVLVARSSLDWMPSRINSLYSDVGAWSGIFRPVMDEIESDEALRFYQFLNYLDGGSFGTGPIDEFVDAMYRLANYMKQQNSRETQVRGMRELEAINGEKGNSIKTVLEISTVIMRKKRKFFCTGEVKEPIVNNKIICKDRILLPIAGTSCRDAIMYWHPGLTEEHYCVGALESKSPVHVMDIEGEMFCKGDDYSKREYLLACDFYEDQEAPVADLLQYYPDPDPEISPKLF